MGKTHLASALGLVAAQHRFSTYYINGHQLIEQLKKAHFENRLPDKLKVLSKYRMLIIDEIGYLPMDIQGANLFFQLIASKSYQRLNGQDLITTPKTEKSNRVITMPQFLADEIHDYLKMLYDIGENDRMFTVTKSYLHREMDRGAKEAGVKRIRIHDIRHSAVSLLIDMGFSATAIADRVGHESIDITYNYAHLFPSKQTEMADKLNMEVEKYFKNQEVSCEQGLQSGKRQRVSFSMSRAASLRCRPTTRT